MVHYHQTREKSISGSEKKIPISGISSDRSRDGILQGRNFTFEISDVFGDGTRSATPGNYIVSLGRSPGGAVIVSGGGDFGFNKHTSLLVPAHYEDPDDPGRTHY
jgi:hypothetical protein